MSNTSVYKNTICAEYAKDPIVNMGSEIRLFAAVLAVMLFLEHLGIVSDTVLIVIILDCRLNSFLSKNGAVDLVSGESVKRLNDCLVCKLQSFGNRLALDHLSSHRAACYRGTAAERTELNIIDDAILADLEKDLHDVAALCISDLAYAVGVLDSADITRMCEVIHYLFTV